MMRKRTLTRILAIPFKNFKEKISITKAYENKGKVEILDNIVLITSWEREI